MKKQKLTDKQMLYMIVGKLTIKLMQWLFIGGIVAGYMLICLNNMTVYR